MQAQRKNLRPKVKLVDAVLESSGNSTNNSVRLIVEKWISTSRR